MQDFWIRIEETRNQSNQPAGAPLDVSIADLNGLPVTGTSSNGDSTACSSDNSVVKIGMLVQVTGDLRMPLD